MIGDIQPAFPDQDQVFCVSSVKPKRHFGAVVKCDRCLVRAGTASTTKRCRPSLTTTSAGRTAAAHRAVPDTSPVPTRPVPTPTCSCTERSASSIRVSKTRSLFANAAKMRAPQQSFGRTGGQGEERHLRGTERVARACAAASPAHESGRGEPARRGTLSNAPAKVPIPRTPLLTVPITRAMPMKLSNTKKTVPN